MINSDKKNLRSFGLILGAIFLFLGLRLFFKYSRPDFLLLALLGGIFVILGVFLPSRLGPIYRIWMKIAWLISWINTRVLLGAFFYIVITPIGLFMKLARKDLLSLKLQKDKDSYWTKRERPEVNLTQYEKQF